MGMAKKFKYNHDTLSFDEARHNILSVLRKAVLWLVVSALFLTGYYALFSRLFSTPEERRLAQINRTLSSSYSQLSKQHAQLQRVVDNLNQRDANIYRRIFESDPPQAAASESQLSISAIEHASNTKLTQQTKQGIEKLSTLVDEQTAFLQGIAATVKDNPSLQSMPSIQPVQNNDLRRTAATYGIRMHPFYKVLKMHSGVDFSAPLGNNVYATGNARVAAVSNNLRATGLTITLDHGNGYTSTYAHLLKANVRTGDYVKRGSVIGLVGNSGRSVAPHLHYEVEKDGHTVNPLHYFFQSVTPDEYQRLIHLASNKGQPLD